MAPSFRPRQAIIKTEKELSTAAGGSRLSDVSEAYAYRPPLFSASTADEEKNKKKTEKKPSPAASGSHRSIATKSWADLSDDVDALEGAPTARRAPSVDLLPVSGWSTAPEPRRRQEE